MVPTHKAFRISPSQPDAAEEVQLNFALRTPVSISFNA
jgi:hypothetical protein